MRPCFKQFFCFFFIVIVLSYAEFSYANEDVFPFHQGNRFPTLFMFLTPSPDRPDLPEKGKFYALASLDYTSIFIEEESDTWEAVVDLEFSTLALSLEMRLCNLLSLTTETAFVKMGKGFLDGFLDEYHSAGGFPDYGRSERPHNEFSYYIKEADGPYWLDVKKNGFSPADSVVSLKMPLIVEGSILPTEKYSFSASLKYSLKLPTGDKDQGLGSGNYDHGLFLLTKFAKKQMTCYLNPGIIFLAPPDTQGLDLSIKNMATLFLGASYSYHHSWLFLAHLNCFTSPYEMNIDFFDEPGVELTFGFNYKWSKGIRFECAFSEDLAGAVPDFTLHSGLNCTF